MKNLLLNIGPLVQGTVLKRPSKYIKSPYVADVLLSENNEEREILAHSASLGCCGLAEKNALVLMKPCDEGKKCSHVIYLSIQKEDEHQVIIGIYPKLAERLAESALKGNFLSNLQNVKCLKREKVIKIKDKVDSRFDFSGIDCDGIPFLMEIKNVPLADYEDLPLKERNKIDFTGRAFNSKVAYFPDGYRKKSTDTISPRALKHIKELTIIRSETSVRTILCFVIQRNDVNRFQPSVIDPEYREAVRCAVEKGVEVMTMVVEWTSEGEAYFIRDDLPCIFT